MKVQGATMKFHVHRLTTEFAATETMENNGEDLPVSSHWILPAKEFQYLWESLHFDSNVKDDVSSMCFICFIIVACRTRSANISICSFAPLAVAFCGHGNDILGSQHQYEYNKLE